MNEIRRIVICCQGFLFVRSLQVLNHYDYKYGFSRGSRKKKEDGAAVPGRMFGLFARDNKVFNHVWIWILTNPEKSLQPKSL
jgi:hypothetical protein